MDEKGFISGAAISILLFSIVFMIFSHLVVVNDLHSASQTGYVVETSRWAGDVSNYGCRENLTSANKNFSEEMDPLLTCSRSGNETNVTYYDNELMVLEVTTVKNYPPTVSLSTSRLRENITFNTIVCNPEDVLREEDRNFSLYYYDGDDESWHKMTEEELKWSDTPGRYIGYYEMNVSKSSFNPEEGYSFRANVSDRGKSGEDDIFVGEIG